MISAAAKMPLKVRGLFSKSPRIFLIPVESVVFFLVGGAARDSVDLLVRVPEVTQVHFRAGTDLAEVDHVARADRRHAQKQERTPTTSFVTMP